MPTIQPNPSVPVTVDPITGTVHVPVDQASGAAVVAEAKASGNLYLVPAGKTFTGIAVLLVGTGVGVTEIKDASSNVYAAAGGTTPGVPAIPVIAPTVSVAGGGGGNQLSVALSGSAEVLSAVIAGYVK
jgi:hypothetical protein